MNHIQIYKRRNTQLQIYIRMKKVSGNISLQPPPPLSRGPGTRFSLPLPCALGPRFQGLAVRKCCYQAFVIFIYMYLYIYIYIRIYIYIYLYLHIYSSIYLYMCLYMQIYTSILWKIIR